MERDRELDHAKPGPKMTSGRSNGVNGLGAQLIGYLCEIFFAQAAKVGGTLNGVQKWSRYRHDRNNILASSRPVTCRWARFEVNLSRVTYAGSPGVADVNEPAHSVPGTAAFVVNVLNSWMVQLVQWSNRIILMTPDHFATQSTERTSHVEVKARVDC